MLRRPALTANPWARGLAVAGAAVALMALAPWGGHPSALVALEPRALAAGAGRALGSLAPRVGAAPAGGPEAQPRGLDAALLAQAEGATHRPVSYASSPSLPGTINAPW